MHRIKHPPLRNKINLTDSAQVRAWARRLGVSADGLKAVVESFNVATRLHRKRPSVQLLKANCAPPA
jgi:hypothetical protein